MAAWSETVYYYSPVPGPGDTADYGGVTWTAAAGNIGVVPHWSIYWFDESTNTPPAWDPGASYAMWDLVADPTIAYIWWVCYVPNSGRPPSASPGYWYEYGNDTTEPPSRWVLGNLYPISLRDAAGEALAGINVAVLDGPPDGVSLSTQPGSPLATVYSDPYGLFPLSQPFQTDNYGEAFFWAFTDISFPDIWRQLTVQCWGQGVRGQIALPISCLMPLQG